MANHELHRTLRFSIAALLIFAGYVASGQAEPPAAPGADKPTDPTIAKPAAAEAKAPREPIYDPEADAKELISSAIKRAKREGKYVLIEWGGNWCSWCYKLHDVFNQDELVRPIVAEEYELVLIDSRGNRELMQEYGGKNTQFAYPHLTILDAQGKVLTNQETSSLEVGPKHDAEAVATFLKKWQPEPTNAEDLLAKALQQATDEGKRVLLHVGTPYCGWCRVLTQFLNEHEAILSRDFVDVKLDTMRMRHGQEVAERFLPKNSAGVPWIVVLDATGKVLSTSVGANGNIGYPMEAEEIDHFISMLTETKQRLTSEDLSSLRKDLDAYRIEHARRQTARQ